MFIADEVESRRSSESPDASDSSTQKFPDATNGPSSFPQLAPHQVLRPHPIRTGFPEAALLSLRRFSYNSRLRVSIRPSCRNIRQEKPKGHRQWNAKTKVSTPARYPKKKSRFAVPVPSGARTPVQHPERLRPSTRRSENPLPTFFLAAFSMA